MITTTITCDARPAGRACTQRVEYVTGDVGEALRAVVARGWVVAGHHQLCETCARDGGR